MNQENPPPFGYFVLVCPAYIKDWASLVILDILTHRFNLMDEGSNTNLDWSALPEFEKYVLPEHKDRITTFSLCDSWIDVLHKNELTKIKELVAQLPKLELLDLSYNYLSGKPGVAFLSELMELRPGLRINIKGNVLAKQNYAFPNGIII